MKIFRNSVCHQITKLQTNTRSAVVAVKSVKKQERLWIELSVRWIVHITLYGIYWTKVLAFSVYLVIYIFFFVHGIKNSVSCKWKIWFIKPFSRSTERKFNNKQQNLNTYTPDWVNYFGAGWEQNGTCMPSWMREKVRKKKTSNNNGFYSMKYSIAMQIKTDSKH